MIRKGKRKNGQTYYYDRAIIAGKKHYVQASTKAAVEREVALLKEKAHRRRLGLPDPDQRPIDITYPELVEKALEGYPHSPQAKTTLDYNLRRSKEALGRVLVRELTSEQIAAWLARLPLKQTTKRATLKAMRYALARAVEWGYRRDNPATKVEMPKEPTYDAHPFESWDEARHVSSAFKSDRDRALVLFACATGLRPQEWQALRWSDIDRENRVVHVRRTIQNGKIARSERKDAQIAPLRPTHRPSTRSAGDAPHAASPRPACLSRRAWRSDRPRKVETWTLDKGTRHSRSPLPRAVWDARHLRHSHSR